MSEDINHDRRRFLGTVAMTFAATQFGMIGSPEAQTSKASLPAIKPGTNTSFGPLKQIDAGVLSVGYAEAGPVNGPPVGVRFHFAPRTKPLDDSVSANCKE